MKVIILSVTPYKEKSAIVSAISEEGYLSFQAHGILESKNPNSGLSIPFSIADVILSEGNTKYHSVKSSNIIFTPLKVNNTLEYLTAIALLSEVINKLLFEEEDKAKLYPTLLKALPSVKSNLYPYMALSYVIGQILNISGYGLTLDKCVICGKTSDIVGLSFSEGGLICKDCYDAGSDSGLNINEIKILRHAILSKEADFPVDKFEKDSQKTVLFKLLEYISDCFGVTFKNVNNL